MTPDISPGSTPQKPLDPDDRISTWSLIKPYWVSEERGTAWSLFIATILINLALVWINVRLNSWNRDFYNALQAKNVEEFPRLMLFFTGIAFAFIILAVAGRYLRQMLGFRWRQWLTTRYLNEWLGKGAFYRIERDRLADNPDQRISDDLQSFANTTLALTLDLMSTLVTLVSFITILWTLAGALTFSLGGTPVTIPGYMVWTAALYALVGSFVIQRVGRKLVPISYQMQKVEADFRFGLIRVRENAEQIALYDGMKTENTHAHTLFGRIRDNWWQFMKYTARYNIALNFYSQVAIVFPLFVASPRYFAGAFSFGTLMQISSAFGTVSDSFSWFINSYSTLVEWRATVNRLREFRRVMSAPRLKESMSPGTEHGGVNLRFVDSPKLTTQSLQLALPNGTPLSAIRDVSIEPGSRWLIRGASGSGKSTLMRAMAGLWPFGSGSIDAPVGAKMMFVPQQSYMPIGTLKAALTYPAAAEAFSDELCRDVLRAARLEGYVDQLDESAHWARVLSPGEQQRLAAARVLLAKPDFLFLDEATSALDPVNEEHLYRLLLDRLPNAAIVSVAHRESVAAFHGETLEVDRADEALEA
ncbi:ABC transporter ATP-binding protein/permease [Paraburkholderia sp.]|uniref:ABC transporter ATP-binding protein/permease n=1 Tax=Paraburkholderia sp. TaxID=1926495 RepID=UPI002387910F|nr:ABC transporter ATP-binding protein/permease [Paraburkholderia sp.]MDE1180679.1 ABC transporter ATP-binding protein/permease [Paraburkholderia sp.]